MQKRKFGNNNLEVSDLGLGCMRMAYGDSPVGDTQEMISFLHAAVDRGITLFDTAEVYSPFTNEDLLGESLPRAELEAAVDASRACEVFFSIGTSGVVQPAAALVHAARNSGAVVVEINTETTPLTPQVDFAF